MAENNRSSIAKQAKRQDRLAKVGHVPYRRRNTRPLLLADRRYAALTTLAQRRRAARNGGRLTVDGSARSVGRRRRRDLLDG